MRKRNKKTSIRIGIVVLLASLVVYLENNFSAPTESVVPSTLAQESSMSVHFIDVGQGDAILIESDGQFMLIDAGENNKGELVVHYLKDQSVEMLDYVIGTHPHSDHIGGLDTVINSLPVNTIIMPDVIHTTKTFEDVLDAIADNDLSITKAVVGNEYNLGSASFIIIAPNSDSYSNLNDYSVGIKINLGAHSFVLTGDAELRSENEMLQNGIDLSAEVYKVAHHGSSSSNSEDFLDAINPSIAVISAGLDNRYGHPHEEIMKALMDRDVEIYQTAIHGTIILTTDGETLTVQTEKIP